MFMFPLKNLAPTGILIKIHDKTTPPMNMNPMPNKRQSISNSHIDP